MSLLNFTTMFIILISIRSIHSKKRDAIWIIQDEGDDEGDDELES
jgi:hypothetical protein